MPRALPRPVGAAVARGARATPGVRDARCRLWRRAQTPRGRVGRRGLGRRAPLARGRRRLYGHRGRRRGDATVAEEGGPSASERGGVERAHACPPAAASEPELEAWLELGARERARLERESQRAPQPTTRGRRRVVAQRADELEEELVRERRAARAEHADELRAQRLGEREVAAVPAGLGRVVGCARDLGAVLRATGRLGVVRLTPSRAAVEPEDVAGVQPRRERREPRRQLRQRRRQRQAVVPQRPASRSASRSAGLAS